MKIGNDPTAALGLSIQAQTLGLIKKLKGEIVLDRVAVAYIGKLMETAPASVRRIIPGDLALRSGA